MTRFQIIKKTIKVPFIEEAVHAMSHAQTPDGVFPATAQAVTYTGFDKVSKVKQGTDSLCYTYGYDHQRIRMEELVAGSSRTKDYVGLCELVTETTGNATTQKSNTYLMGPYGVFAVVETEDGTNSIHYILKDNLGSWVTITNVSGTVEQQLSYDAWGNLRNPNTWSGSFTGTPMFDRGYTGHEHLSNFGLINMNGRVYDPVMSSFLSVDQYVQSPSNSQNFNRYAYCLNNPLRYVDPDGEEFITTAIVVGTMLIGAYTGGVLTNGGTYNPMKWNWNKTETYDGLLLGSVFGGLSGFAGVSITGMGFAFCNTASIAASSLIYSTGMYFTGKCTNFDYGISLGVGVASFDFTHGEFGYLGKKGNTLLQNIGYGLGALANLQDIVAGGNGTKIQVKSRKELAGHSELGEYSNNGYYQDGGILVSVGPNEYLSLQEKGINVIDDLRWELQYVRRTLQGNSISGINTPMIQPNDPQFVTTLNNVNGKLLHKMTNNLNMGRNLINTGNLKYGLLYGCVNYTSRALAFSGVLNINALLPVTAPVLLNAELAIRSFGISISPYMIQYNYNR